MPDNTYDVGDVVRVLGTYRSTAGAVGDPTVVRVKYRAPGSTMVTFTFSTGGTDITKVSTGVYRSDVQVNTAGVWRYRWDSSGALRAAGEKQFRVKPGLV